LLVGISAELGGAHFPWIVCRNMAATTALQRMRFVHVDLLARLKRAIENSKAFVAALAENYEVLLS